MIYQYIAVALIVSVAVLFIIKKIVSNSKNRFGGCQGCSGCQMTDVCKKAKKE